MSSLALDGFPQPAAGGTGTVTSVTAADTSIVVGGTAAAPTVRTNTLDVIATDHPPVAAVALNAQKITGLANGAAATDALAVGQVLAAGAIPIADLADPTTGKVIGSTGSVAAAVFPPSYEFAYAQVTSNTVVLVAVEASAQTLFSLPATGFDGGLVWIEFGCPFANPSGGVGASSVVVSLWEGASEIGRLAVIENDTATAGEAVSLIGKIRLTPTAASHTYTVKANAVGVQWTLWAGNGSGTNNPVMFAAATKI